MRNQVDYSAMTVFSVDQTCLTIILRVFLLSVVLVGGRLPNIEEKEKIIFNVLVVGRTRQAHTPL